MPSPRKCRVVVVTVAASSRYSVRVCSGQRGRGQLLHHVPFARG